MRRGQNVFSEISRSFNFQELLGSPSGGLWGLSTRNRGTLAHRRGVRVRRRVRSPVHTFHSRRLRFRLSYLSKLSSPPPFPQARYWDGYLRFLGQNRSYLQKYGGLSGLKRASMSLATEGLAFTSPFSRACRGVR